MAEDPCPYQPIPQRRIEHALAIIHQQKTTNQWSLDDIETALTGQPHQQPITPTSRRQQ